MRGSLGAFLIAALIVFCSTGLAADSTWMTRDSVPENVYEEAVVIAVDDSGNVFVTGNCMAAKEGHDFVTIKYTPNGDTVWTKRFDGLKQGDDRPVSLALSSDGSVYVTGTTQAKESAKLKSVAITIMDSATNKVGQQTFKERDVDIAIIKYSDRGGTAVAENLQRSCKRDVSE